MKHDSGATTDIHRLLELQKLLLSFSQVDRKVHRKHSDKYIYENDTEHSYNLAMSAWYLAQQFPELNVDLVIKYALVHDLVEIHAGDTYVYGSQQELASKVEREAKAAEKLKGEWSDFPAMNTLIHSYEGKADPESLFVYALDKIMPIMLIYIHDGYTWKKEHISAQMLHDIKLPQVTLSPEVLPYYNQLYELLLSQPGLIKPN